MTKTEKPFETELTQEEKTQALADLLGWEVQATKEVDTKRGLTKKTIRSHENALEKVCGMLGINPDDVTKRYA